MGNAVKRIALFLAVSLSAVPFVAIARGELPGGEAFRETMLGQDALPIGIAVDPRGTRACVAISGANRIAVVDPEAWKVAGYWRTGNQPDALGIVGARD